MQGAGWNERVAVPAARDAKTLRVTVAGPDGVLGAAEHPLHKVSGINHVTSSVIPTECSIPFAQDVWKPAPSTASSLATILTSILHARPAESGHELGQKHNRQ